MKKDKSATFGLSAGRSQSMVGEVVYHDPNRDEQGPAQNDEEPGLQEIHIETDRERNERRLKELGPQIIWQKTPDLGDKPKKQDRRPS